MRPNGTRRQRGAYFTPARIADLLAGWAIRSPTDSVLDPAAGRGHLLAAAAKRLRLLGAHDADSIYGIEVHKGTHKRLRAEMTIYGTPKQQLIWGDFFSLSSRLQRCDVVLANPPYVRHHSIPREALLRMRASLQTLSASIDGKASAWGYFVVKATEHLEKQGRLAAVLPTELLTSDYGKDVASYLRQRFTRLGLVLCDRAVFPELSQRVLLCLAEGFHEPDGRSADCRVSSLGTKPGESLSSLDAFEGWVSVQGFETLPRVTAGQDLVALEKQLSVAPGVRHLGDLSDVGIGYVTGDNEFFHLTESQLRKARLGKKNVVAALVRARQFDGIVFDKNQWSRLQRSDEKCWLLALRSSTGAATRRMLARGRRHRVNKRAKCSGRNPWWRVPIGSPPPAILVYLGGRVRIARNAAGAQVSNSLYALRNLKSGSATTLAVGSLTSLCQLSVLLESRELGGGLRKLEPSDARRLLLPVGKLTTAAARRVEKLARAGEWESARLAADDLMLRGALGWPPELVSMVQRGFAQLRTVGLGVTSAATPTV